MKAWTHALLSLLACYGAGLFATLFLSERSLTWYTALEKPSFAPMASAFLPIGIILYGLMAIALWLVWAKDANAREWHGWVPLFFAHLLLNAAWIIYFFGFQAPFIALIDSFLLTMAVILLVAGASEYDWRASVLLTPYLAWTVFVTVLNACIWYLN